MVFAPRNLVAYICTHVFENTRPILLIAHESDGDWQFMCGGTDHGAGEGHVVGVAHLMDRDPSINECANLPNGFEAERSATDQAWIRRGINEKSC